MKKLINFFTNSVVGVALSLISVSGIAVADEVKFYAGAGIDYSKYSIYNDMKEISIVNKDKGLGILLPVIGAKFNENFGVEAGFNLNKKINLGSKVVNGITYSTMDLKVRNFYMDFMGFIPVADQVELIGGLGIGRFITKDTKSSSKGNHPNCLRVKLGAQYNVNSNFGVRALATYQHINNKINIVGAVNKQVKFIRNMKSIGLDAIYTF